MEKVQERLKLLMEELIELEKQLIEEQGKLEEDNDKSKKIINCGIELERSREVINKAEKSKGKLQKKFNIHSKIDNITTRLFWPVIGLGSIFSFSLVFISGLPAMFIGYSITMLLTLLIGAVSITAENKCYELLDKINIHKRVISFECEQAKEYELQIRTLSASSMMQMQKNFLNLNIGNIRDNIIYTEEVIWNILENQNPDNDNEYISDLRTNFYPKLFVPETESQKTKKKLKQERR